MKRQPVTVLIVDDLPVMRAGWRSMLQAPDIKIVGEATSFKEAYDRLRGRHPNVALVGLSVCGRRDLGLLEHVKERWPKTSLLVVSRSMRAAEVSRALALGCSGYVPKGIERKALQKSIRAVARGECIVEPRLLREVLASMAARRAASHPGATALTAPERDVLRLIAEGRTNRQIAERLRYSIGTVKDYVQRIIQKLEVSDRTQAAVKAVRRGLLD